MEKYSEESFMRQYKERGGATFSDMPCPVHGSYPSSINLYGMSVACCTEQKKWFESEVERLELSQIRKQFEAKAESRRRAEVKATKRNLAVGKALQIELKGSIVKRVVSISADSNSFWYESLEIQTSDGKRFSVRGWEEGLFIETKPSRTR